MSKYAFDYYRNSRVTYALLPPEGWQAIQSNNRGYILTATRRADSKQVVGLRATQTLDSGCGGCGGRAHHEGSAGHARELLAAEPGPLRAPKGSLVVATAVGAEVAPHRAAAEIVALFRSWSVQ